MLSSQMSSQLKLAYDFSSDPDPIRCSVDGANPNVITLTVTISNSAMQAVQVSSITISIPCGAEDSRSLTTSPDLPAPSSISSSDWLVDTHISDPAVQHGTVRIKPASGSSQSLGGKPIAFRLANIQVNKTPSAQVPITITEFTPDKVGPDNTTYSLKKQASTEMVSTFSADPATLNDFDLTTTLRWNTTSAGAGCTFELNADDNSSWHPRRCVQDGNCFTAKDGVGGVTSVPLVPGHGSAVTFTLDVIVADVSGNRSVYARKTTQVQIGLPKVLANSYMDVLMNGRIIDLHWTTTNAAYCTVSLDDGTILVENAPTDTYVAGYKLLMSKPGDYHVIVTAWAASGPAHMDHQMAQRVTLPAATTIPTGGDGARSPAVADGSLLIGTAAGVTVTDPTTWQQKVIPVAGGVSDITATVAGWFYAANLTTQSVTAINVAANQSIGVIIPGGGLLDGVAQTPDGSLCLVSIYDPAQYGPCLAVIDSSSHSVEANRISLSSWPAYVAVDPNGTYAIVGDYSTAQVTIVDIAARAVRCTVALPSPSASQIATTADGRFAVVPTGDSVAIVDINAGALKETIPAPCWSSVIATSPDRDFAFIVNNDSGGEIFAIDLASFTLVNGSIRLPTLVSGLTVLPNSPSLVVTTYNTETATIL